MTANKWIIWLAVAWAVCFAMSFGHSYVFEPVGDGFSKAMATLGAWVLWQICAMGVAVAALVVRLGAKAGLDVWPRRIAPVPIIVTGVLWLGTAAWLTYDMTREFAGDMGQSGAGVQMAGAGMAQPPRIAT